MTEESGSVLIVGRDEAQLASIAAQVEAHGYVPTTLLDPAAAMAAVDTSAPDLLLLAVDGPDPAATDVILRLAARKAPDLSIPIVVLAAPEHLAEALLLLERGAHDYVLLPLHPQVLRARLDSILFARRARADAEHPGRTTTLLKIEQDIQTARRIQESFLPKDLPQVDNWELAAKFQPAREVAGDFYDAFTLNQGRRVGIVIGDVCDKGVGAALFMALFRSLIRAFAQQHYSLRWMGGGDSDDFLTSPRTPDQRRSIPSTGTTGLKNAMNLTNNYIINNHGDSNMFATMFFGVLDPGTGSLAYVNAGHNPPWLFNQTGIKTRLTPTGPAVGMLPDVDYPIQQVDFAPGDILLTFTDGVPESRDIDGRFFTEARMRALINDPPPATAKDLLDRIYTHVTEHIGTAAQFDDITMLAVRRAPSAG